jgi:nucleoid DNA-binding protein
MPDNAASLEAILAEIRQQSAVEVEAYDRLPRKNRPNRTARQIRSRKIAADILEKGSDKSRTDS